MRFILNQNAMRILPKFSNRAKLAWSDQLVTNTEIIIHFKQRNQEIYRQTPVSIILVVGCVSLDTIHLDSKGARKTYNTIGGAGLFTAMAAAHAGARVTLYAPKPKPMPEALCPVEKALEWIGPEVAEGNLPSLEIVHHGQGRATLLAASWGPENLLTPEDLRQRIEAGCSKEASADHGHGRNPAVHGTGKVRNQVNHEFNQKDNQANHEVDQKDNQSIYETVHIAALSTAMRQLEFFKFFQNSKVAARISAGTYARAVSADGDSVRQLFEQCDFFFMNSNEANLLLPGKEITTSNNHLVFVTDGQNGATCYSKYSSRHIDALPADELDPTGAGDTFCGATLAGLARHFDAEESARLGAQLAARVIEKPGSNYYF